MNIPELEKVGNSIIFTGEFLDIYIPRASFENKNANYNGEYIHTMGIFVFEVKTQKNIDENKSGVFHKLTMPNSIDFQYSDNYVYTGPLMGALSDTYEVFRLESGNQFIANVLLQQESSEVISFVKSLHNGYIPKIVPYDKILTLYHDILAINNVSLNAPSVIYELIISELCRYSKDLSKPYREIASRREISQYEYTNIRLNRLPMLNSTFAGLSFENMNDSIITSLERTKTGKEEKESPLEKTIKY